MAGRKPLPTKLKMLKGTVKPCRINKNEPEPEACIPVPPAHLKGHGLEEWGRMSVFLYEMGLLSGMDMACLAAYCTAYGRWCEAEELLAEEGLVSSTSNGNIIQNPLVGIANTAMRDMHKYLSDFGMSPSSRSKVSAVKPEKKKSKWDL